jgi:hypothetical protein
MSGAPEILRDSPGAAWEKRGNSLWVGCAGPGCKTWFPVSPVMTRPGAPSACCPVCHSEFKLAAPSPRQGDAR